MKITKYLLKRLALITLLTPVFCFSQVQETFVQNLQMRSIKAKNVDQLCRKFIYNSIINKQLPKSIVAVKEILIGKLKTIKINNESKEDAQIIDYLSNTFLFLELCQNNKISFSKAPFLQFLLSSQKRIAKIVTGISAHDKVPEVFNLLEKMFQTKNELDEYFDLALALAVVWDQPRSRIHAQIGTYNAPIYYNKIVDRYNFYKTLYDKNKAKLRYRFLDFQDLIYVVDTPIPLSELEWTKKNVKGTISNWGKQYSTIKYDHKRLKEEVYTWPESQGIYTLKNIAKHGGICVDQAYYCIMTARAFGIPALYFSGDGKRGGHAWASYMKRKDSWTLDVGRYSSDKYNVGFTTNPQTNNKMTDHQVSILYNKLFSKRGYIKGKKYLSYAKVLAKEELTERSLAFSKSATKMAPLNEQCWDFYIDLIKNKNDDTLLLEALDKKIKIFKKYPDIYVNSQVQKCDLLKKLGRTKEAEKIMKVTQRLIKRDKNRDDLERNVVIKQVDELMEVEKFKEARKLMERLIRKHKNEGAKLLSVIDKYLKITSSTEQTKQAERFIPPIIKAMYKTLPPAVRRQAIQRMITAYANNMNTKKVKSITKLYIDK